MSDRQLLGPFEEMVLLAVVRVGEASYGMRVRREVAIRSGRDVTIGAVYAALDRLEAKGYLSSCDRPGDASRRGRGRRYFRLQPAGLRALREAKALHDRVWKGLDPAQLQKKGTAS